MSVAVWLENRVNVSEKLWKSFGRRPFVNDIHSDRQPLKCREVQSDIPGLIVFRRINSEECGGMHCGGTSAVGTRWETTVYGKKVDDGAYEFVVKCSVNCRLYGEYQGWTMQLAFASQDLHQWPLMMSGVRGLLDRATMVIDHNDGTAHR